MTKCFNPPKPLDFAPEPCFTKEMKNEIAVPIYESLEALLAAEVPALRAHVQALASELAEKPLTVDQALALTGF